MRSREEWFGWNTWRNAKNEFNRQYVFSLIDYFYQADTWLFGGIFEVLRRGSDINTHSYELEEKTEYSQYVGRLKISLPKPSRGRAFCLENHLVAMLVKEILPEPFTGQVFPGYESINHDFSELEPIFRLEKADWKAALQYIKGVYMITDKANGKRYIGSAYGHNGIWARWSCYISTGHGGNVDLKRLIDSQGYGYARENFRLTLLEYLPMKKGDDEIKREGFWKEVMLSRGANGYNKN